MKKVEKVKNIKQAFENKLISGGEYVKNMDDVNGWKNAKERKEAEEMRKQTEAMIHFNGDIILEIFEEVVEDGAQNHEEALAMIIENNLLFGSVVGFFLRRKIIETYGFEYVLRIIEDEYGAEVWTHVSPTDLGALVDLATEAEARTHARHFYTLATS